MVITCEGYCPANAHTISGCPVSWASNLGHSLDANGITSPPAISPWFTAVYGMIVSDSLLFAVKTGIHIIHISSFITVPQLTSALSANQLTNRWMDYTPTMFQRHSIFSFHYFLSSQLHSTAWLFMSIAIFVKKPRPLIKQFTNHKWLGCINSNQH